VEPRAQTAEFKETVRARSPHGRLLYLRGDWDGSAAVFAALMSDSANLVNALGYAGTIAAHQGDVESARRIANELAEPEVAGLRGTNTLWRARIAALLGERDESIALLQRTFGEGLVYGIWMRCDTDLELLHGFPSFEELTRPTG